MTLPLVYVVDDDEAMRTSLTFLLDTAGLRAVGYESAPRFLREIDPDQHCCIIADVRMPEMTGLDLVRELRVRRIQHPVIIITGHGDVPLAVEAMKAGVSDFFEKPFDDEALLRAVQIALDKDAEGAAHTAERQRFEQMLADLSPRERDVLQGLVAGKANKVIAYELGISPRTVEVYRANVMTKTGAGSLSDLVRIALLTQFGHGGRPT